ncbi:hypothetical protein [Nonlabens agnitus]|uniref:Uncharacterized protein n=1 Tax=Nonlabens agnitus TaxID=870484 RepID=A0A2S9WX01_9FLAO|nr:hypothetical protein [Nonlabens agnitus]PRP67971.1 hypothetical protein BST86_13165 [Nonlabens agnitus]
MNKRFFIAVLVCFSLIVVKAQVGLNTITPEAFLDVASTDAGVLLPRITLTNRTSAAPVTNPNGGSLVDGTMVWNTGLGALQPAGFYYWQNGQWNQLLADNEQQVYFGKMIIDAAGSKTITGIPFRPKSIEFTAYNKVSAYNVKYRSGNNNSNDLRMAAGYSTGYATLVGGNIQQQAIAEGHNGSSINNIGAYSASDRCIAAYYVNNNGLPIGTTNGSITEAGVTEAELTSFDVNGFSLNVRSFISGEDLVVLFKAYKY